MSVQPTRILLKVSKQHLIFRWSFREKMHMPCVLGAAFLASPVLWSQATPPVKVVTAKQVNGTWKNEQGVFKVWALGKQRLQVEFSVAYTYESQMGPMANTGEGKGIAFIEGDTAILKPDDSDESCKITMRFGDGLLIVQESGDCGMGHNVTATGKYKKTNSKKPVFED